ncbi:MAG: extracellular solute-binding protein [Clostridia bacterium]|nr:extracellular solute-binding protein [Clostridia bacterium]
MRRGAVWILVFVMVFSTACAESTQKAPDFLMEGYDGGVTYRVWETNLFFERMQEKTGVSFQLHQYTDASGWDERKKEMLEGTNLPDVLFKAELSSAEVRDLYQNGRIIDLKPYLETYAPDLWKLLQEHPEWEKAITMADGTIPALPAINMLQNNDAMWINSSWLKKLKLEIPKTAEELMEVLRAFKTGDPNGNRQQDEIPLAFLGMWELRFLGHAFGIIDNDYYVTAKDGTVTSSLTSDENRAFLTWLHQLWEEGLLDQDGFIYTDSLRQITDEKKVIPYGMIMTSTPLTILPNTALEQFSIMEPLEYDGKQIYRDLTGDVIRGTFAVTSACREPEKLVAWVNYLYTEEGSRLAFYGMEGEEYIWNEDGQWEWNDSMETVANEILPMHTISEGGTAPGYTDASFQLKYREDTTREAVESLTGLKQFSVLPYPPVTLNAENEKRVAEIQNELSRYAEKTMACFVAGDIELTDENWDTFCRTVEGKGLTEMIEIWQNALR